MARVVRALLLRDESSKMHYTANFKRKVIAVANETGNNLATARRFGISEVNVRSYLGNTSRLAACSSTWKAFARPQCGRLAELEEDLAWYMIEIRNSCVASTV